MNILHDILSQFLTPLNLNPLFEVLTCSGIVSTIGVLMKPGQIAFTRIPNFPSSLAADFVNPITPAFEAE